MWTSKPALQFATFAAVLLSASTTWAGPAPTGLWIDHTGRGAVEITKCGSRLCGHVAWLKDEKNSETCGVQVIGDAKPMRNGRWDRGWIYDPEANSRYDVELKPIGSKKLRVLGYAGTKFLSKTMIWKRAPLGLKKCGKSGSGEAVEADVTEKAVKASQNAKKETKPASNKPEVKSADLPPKVKTTGATREVNSEGTSSPKTKGEAKPETKDNRKGTLTRVAKAVADMSDSGKGASRLGSKRNCQFTVPYIKRVVKVPCGG